jgi:DNA-binding Lrp family transcriptional regulator
VKDIELRLVSELMKNSRRSDRELAKVLGVSQPTVSRVIKRLEEERVLQGYTAIPDMRKMGIELIAIIFANARSQETSAQRLQIAKQFVKSHPNIIFASTGIGAGSERVVVSLHKNYADYTKFRQELQTVAGGLFTLSETFLISYKSDNILRQLSFEYLEDYLARGKQE